MLEKCDYVQYVNRKTNVKFKNRKVHRYVEVQLGIFLPNY